MISQKKLITSSLLLLFKAANFYELHHMNTASLIIPTFNRVMFVDRIIRTLLLQDISKLSEVIILDSDSKDGTKELIELYQNSKQINIIYENVENSVSIKRNRGIEVSTSDCLIFIDDDCIPVSGFIDKHLDSCSKKGMRINCGNVYFDKKLINESNYIEYRNSRHLPYLCSDGENKILDYRTIVTMNMSARKSDLVECDLMFDENFIGYGMEDNEFGYRAESAGFDIVCNDAAIVHIEDKSPIEYASKIYHTARDGVKKVKEVMPAAVNGLSYSFYFEDGYVHKNKFLGVAVKSFRFLFNIRVAKFLLRILLVTDKTKLLYFRPFYMFVFACCYRKGVMDRGKSYERISDVSEGWYEKI